MREVVLDTETTGLDPLAGHRLVEIGCVELVNMVATGRSLQLYLNPEMLMPAEAYKVHGLSDEFLADKPLFADKVDALIEFLGDAQLVIHNAQFDLGFINAELVRAGRLKLTNEYVDTVSLARRKFPGQRASLDALCERFNIDNTKRTKHGALLDSELLAEVYLELSGGRQHDLGLAPEMAPTSFSELMAIKRPVRPARPHAASESERAAHAEFLKKVTNPIWLKE
ncbi:MAG: DNA polymerase III subunit epsilon [Alphaproteobacteria bacterium]|jgi:DNA polymerase-3 subunit epsilon|nr:DNA polymerase III subunit epsilon [Alphaproteobacteria bacterium]